VKLPMASETEFDLRSEFASLGPGDQVVRSET